MAYFIQLLSDLVVSNLFLVFISTSFQLVNRKTFIAFLWSKSKRCFVLLLCAWFSSVSFLQQQGNSISNLYLIWTNDEFVKQKYLHSLDERLSLVCLHFTLFTLRFFTLWNKFQNLYFKLTFVRLHDCAVLDFVCSCAFALMQNWYRRF